VDRSFLSGNGVYCVPTLIPTAVNDKLLFPLIQLYLIDALPLEAQDITLDVDSHCPVLCNVSEALYTNRLRGHRHPFSLTGPEKSHPQHMLLIAVIQKSQSHFDGLNQPTKLLNQ
ncbi:MAG: hypothetical protein ACK5ME_08140, partial [Parahaliea sp.]